LTDYAAFPEIETSTDMAVARVTVTYLGIGTWNVTSTLTEYACLVLETLIGSGMT